MREGLKVIEKYIVLDIETTGLNPWIVDRYFDGSEVTCICAKAVTGKDDHSFSMSRDRISESKLLSEFHGWLGGYSTYNYLLVTKNGKRFDIPFLLARCVVLKSDFGIPITLSELTRYKQFDLHEITSKWVSLDDMAKLLGVPGKIGSGKNAINLFKSGRLKELEKYCMRDVEVTEQVFLRHQELKGMKR